VVEAVFFEALPRGFEIVAVAREIKIGVPPSAPVTFLRWFPAAMFPEPQRAGRQRHQSPSSRRARLRLGQPLDQDDSEHRRRTGAATGGEVYQAEARKGVTLVSDRR
jgi:hypothetical protein